MTKADREMASGRLIYNAERVGMWADVNDYFMWDTIELMSPEQKLNASERLGDYDRYANIGHENDAQFRNGFFFALGNMLKLQHQIAQYPETPEAISKETWAESWRKSSQKLKDMI